MTDCKNCARQIKRIEELIQQIYDKDDTLTTMRQEIKELTERQKIKELTQQIADNEDKISFLEQVIDEAQHDLQRSEDQAYEEDEDD